MATEKERYLIQYSYCLGNGVLGLGFRRGGTFLFNIDTETGDTPRILLNVEYMTFPHG